MIYILLSILVSVLAPWLGSRYDLETPKVFFLFLVGPFLFLFSVIVYNIAVTESIIPIKKEATVYPVPEVLKLSQKKWRKGSRIHFKVKKNGETKKKSVHLTRIQVADTTRFIKERVTAAGVWLRHPLIRKVPDMRLQLKSTHPITENVNPRIP